MVTIDFMSKTKLLIDNLKGICASYGLGNDGNEFKIITQTFLYKFMNDKFAHQVKQVDKKLAKADNWEELIGKYSDKNYEMLLLQLGPDTPKLKPEHFISSLFAKQNKEQFAQLFDDTLRDIAILNRDIFSVRSDSGEQDLAFDELSQFINDRSKRDNFCKAIINKLVDFSFENIFHQKFDFFATIFEYLIKDYNKDGGGKYAEYYTPHAVAKIMAGILVDKPVKNVTCYDPAAGSGMLLMNLAHAIGEDRCSIYSQDVSQKSTGMLRLNLVLNDLVHSIQNVIQGNTLEHPYHKDDKGNLQKFDYIVSNPPFKLDFSDYRDRLDSKENKERFFAGIPNIPKKEVEKMPIYLLFIQHILFSLKKAGKAAVVVPTGFLTAKSGIEKKLLHYIVDNRCLGGVISMPSNIFATTGTNVSILFLDKSNIEGKIVLMDASSMGEEKQDGKNMKTFLRDFEEQEIINVFNNRVVKEDFSVCVTYEDIKEKKYSLSAGQYFEVKIEYSDITTEEFNDKINDYQKNLESLFAQSKILEGEIKKELGGLVYDN